RLATGKQSAVPRALCARAAGALLLRTSAPAVFLSPDAGDLVRSVRVPLLPASWCGAGELRRARFHRGARGQGTIGSRARRRPGASGGWVAAAGVRAASLGRGAAGKRAAILVAGAGCRRRR